MLFNFTRFAALLLFSCVTACSSGGGGGSTSPSTAPPPMTDGVSTFSSGQDIRTLTGANDVSPSSLLPARDGRFLTFDDSSRSVLLFGPDGTVFLFTSREELEALTGAAVNLGPMDQFLSGGQIDELIAADANSGLLVRISGDGTSQIHTSEAAITQVTGAGEANMSLPRFLTTNQFVAQDLVTLDILLFSTSGGAVAPFVAPLALAVAAGVAPDQVAVAGWARGGASGALFARFATANNIVRIAPNGGASRHVQASRLAQLFPEIANLRVLEIATDTLSDAMIVLLGDGNRGVAVAVVNNDNPRGGVFATPEELEEVAGPTYDISDIGILSDGIPFAIDRAGVQVLTFGEQGVPLLLSSRESFERESGVSAPDIRKAVRLGASAVIVPEAASDNFLRVE